MIEFLIILIVSFLLQMFLPWWIIVIISFVTCAALGKAGKTSLWAPFFAIFLLWTAVAMFKTIPNDNILVNRVAEMLGLKAWGLVLLLSALLGSFAAAISGFCGYHFKRALTSKKTTV